MAELQKRFEGGFCVTSSERIMEVCQHQGFDWVVSARVGFLQGRQKRRGERLLYHVAGILGLRMSEAEEDFLRGTG